jgi:uncharacterized Rmd1/YagE family protein
MIIYKQVIRCTYIIHKLDYIIHKLDYIIKQSLNHGEKSRVQWMIGWLVTAHLL